MAASTDINVGSALFGIGWGVGGVCPGPGIVSFGGNVRSAGVFLPSLFAGMAMNDFIFGAGPWAKNKKCAP
jgi:uncharacterized membrane protein YedE/YeeE